MSTGVVADAWETRYQRIAQLHRRGYTRRRRDPETPPSIAPLLPIRGWREAGDVPLLVPIIDPEQREILKLSKQPFATTSPTGATCSS